MRYRLAQASFINDKLVPANSEIEVPPLGRDRKTGELLLHKPGPHWEALDDEAKAHCAACAHQFTGEIPDVMDKLAGELRTALDRANSVDSDKIAAAVAAAMQPQMTAMASVLGEALAGAIGQLGSAFADAAAKPVDHDAIVAAVTAGVAAALDKGKKTAG